MPIICLQTVCKVHSNAQLEGEGSSRFGGFVVLSYSHQSPLFWVMVILIHTAHTHTHTYIYIKHNLHITIIDTLEEITTKN